MSQKSPENTRQLPQEPNEYFELEHNQSKGGSQNPSRARGHGTVNQPPYSQGSFQILHGTKSLAGDNQGLSGWHPVLSERAGVGAGGSQTQTSLTQKWPPHHLPCTQASFSLLCHPGNKLQLSEMPLTLCSACLQSSQPLRSLNVP